MTTSLLAQPVLLIDFDDVQWVTDAGGRRLGSSFRWGGDGRALGLRELDERTAMLVHPRECSSGGWFSRYGRYAVTRGEDHVIGYVTNLGGEASDGSPIVCLETSFSSRTGVVAADGLEVAQAFRLSRQPGKPSNPLTRWMSSRYRFEFSSGREDLHGFAIGAVFIQHVTRLDD